MAQCKKNNKRKPRKTEHLPEVKKYYIFCEGQETEPCYFEAFKKYIENNPIYKNTITVSIKGTGKETIKIIKEAENYITYHNIKKANIWCVYDKDDFPSQQFNNASSYVNQLNKKNKDLIYNVAWSNQCIEYWFLLHFDYYDVNISRNDYTKKLDAKFQKLNNTKYKKNDSKIFDILTFKGNPKKAIKFAEDRLSKCQGKADADSVPATKVHLLVKELSEYLPENLKNRYL